MVYTIDVLPQKFQLIIKLNPMFWVVDNYHRVLAFGRPPDLLSLTLLVLLAISLLGLAFMLFRKAGGEMVDVL